MRENLIISGKGGTGKTSLTGTFAHLATNKIICDLDVDAPDLHLLLQPMHKRQEEFHSGHEAEIDGEICDGCGLCAAMCLGLRLTRCAARVVRSVWPSVRVRSCDFPRSIAANGTSQPPPSARWSMPSFFQAQRTRAGWLWFLSKRPGNWPKLGAPNRCCAMERRGLAVR
jgi:ferredoxin